MKGTLKVAALVVVAILAGCGHSGTVPPSITTRATETTVPQSATLPFTTIGNFTEYSLPAGVNPNDLTRGPYETIYFVSSNTPFGAASKLYQMKDTTGHVTVFTAPAPYETWSSAITTRNGLIVYVLVNHNIPQDAFYFANVSPTGHYTFSGAGYFEDGISSNLAVAANGGIWLGYCIDPCNYPDDGTLNGIRLTDYFIPVGITPGPGGNIYASAGYFGPPPGPGTPDSRVYVASTSTYTILHTFNFPIGSGPVGITTGPDHNLWITEFGSNKIARMTPSGVITHYGVPTANAGPIGIVSGYDGALFFTESNANKIGRITTTGSVTEYRIPTVNSHPTGITPCSPTHCGVHGGVWFTETNANKIGRFNAPI